MPRSEAVVINQDGSGEGEMMFAHVINRNASDGTEKPAEGDRR
jgi:hypothetical protein